MAERRLRIGVGGTLATYAAAALAGGVIEGEEGDTFEAGRLGEYEVGADGEIVLGPPTVFDSSTIADFEL